MTSRKPDVLELASLVLKFTEHVVYYLKQNERSDIAANPMIADVPETPEYEALRIPLNEAANDLLRIVNGPKNTLRSFLSTHYDLAAYQAALELKFFESVPVDGEVRLSELAKSVDVDEDRTGRIMRLLATQNIFFESEPEVFKHTASSAMLAINTELNAAASSQMDEGFKAASETSTCIKMSRHSSNKTDSPFQTRHQTDLYQYYHQNPLKGARFAQAMAGVAQLGGHQIHKLRHEYQWESLGETKVVDIGGGSGHVSLALAEIFPNLSFVVQDISPQMLAQGRNSCDDNPKDRDAHANSPTQSRLTFMQHDFFTPQPIRDANVYFFRQCFHNYNDADCVRILQALVPALECCSTGTPLLINDIVLPEPGRVELTGTGAGLGEEGERGLWTKFEEHGLRQLDIAMLVLLGAKQRTAREFEQVLRTADERFELYKVYSEGSMGLLEVHLRNEK